MTEEHLALAYSLALSEFTTDQLCSENTFAQQFPEQTFSFVERELIGTEAAVIRGNESYDWIDIGTIVDFWLDGLSGRQTGIVQAIQVEKHEDWTAFYALILRNGTRRTVRVDFQSCRSPR